MGRFWPVNYSILSKVRIPTVIPVLLAIRRNELEDSSTGRILKKYCSLFILSNNGIGTDLESLKTAAHGASYPHKVAAGFMFFKLLLPMVV